MKIAILSCFYPFRGGISQFNANLLCELSKSHTVKAFNFTRQYPAFLFPGKTQYVTAEDEAVPVESTALLDTASPVSWLKTAKAIGEWGPDVLIVRYWMSYFAPSLGIVARRLRPGCKVIAIVDNIIPHERHFFDVPLARFFLKGLDATVTLCEDVARDLLAINPRSRNLVLTHPVYSHFGSGIPRNEAEAMLGLESGRKNLLFFGLIREYKGLDILLDAFSRLDGSYQLIIAGEPYGSFEKYQRAIDASPGRDRIHVFPDYIRDSEVKNYFSAADVVVLPYRSATQSGIGNIAFHFEVPMIVTDVGGLRETIGDKGTGLIAQDCTAECVSREIDRFFSSPELRDRMIDAIRAEKEKLSWSRFSEELTKFAESL